MIYYRHGPYHMVHMSFENLLKPRITYRCICIIIIWATNYSKVKQSWNIDRRLFSTRITFISFQGLFEEFIQLNIFFIFDNVICYKL